MVLAFHAAGLHSWGWSPATSLRVYSANQIALGQAGVVLFFAISGYLIAGPYIRALASGAELPATGRYALRRIARIAPAYWVALLAAVLLADPALPGPSAGSLLAHILFLQGVIPGEDDAILSVAWTLTIEACFYIAVPLVAHRLRSHRVAITPNRMAFWAVTAWMVSVLLMLLTTVAFPDAPTNSWQHDARFNAVVLFGLFCPGILIAIGTIPDRTAPNAARRVLAVLSRHAPASLAVAACVIALVTLAAAGAITLLPRNGDIALYYLGLSVWAGLVLACCLGRGAWTWWWTRPVAAIGVASYGIYLWHGPLMLVAVRYAIPAFAGYPAGWMVDIAAFTLLTLVPASLSWHFLERPALQWASRARLPSRTRSRVTLSRRWPVAAGALAIVGLGGSVSYAMSAARGSSPPAVASAHRGNAPATSAPTSGSRAAPSAGASAPPVSGARSASAAGRPPSPPAEPGLQQVPVAVPAVCSDAELATALVGIDHQVIAPGTPVTITASLRNLSAGPCTTTASVTLLVTDAKGAVVYEECSPAPACPPDQSRLLDAGAEEARAATWDGRLNTCAQGVCTFAPAVAGAYTLSLRWVRAVTASTRVVAPATALSRPAPAPVH
jgi:peptidoglycan/LPS O-acetylase OafA/YrhL